MALLVSLIDYVQAIVVIHRVHLGVVGIMAGTDSVDVMTLHKENVLEHGPDRNRFPIERIDVVAIGALEISQDSVDIELVILELDFPEAMAEEGSFKSIPLTVKKFHLNRVKIRVFCGPKMRP